MTYPTHGLVWFFSSVSAFGCGLFEKLCHDCVLATNPLQRTYGAISFCQSYYAVSLTHFGMFWPPLITEFKEGTKFNGS